MIRVRARVRVGWGSHRSWSGCVSGPVRTAHPQRWSDDACAVARANGNLTTYDLGSMYTLPHRPYQAENEFMCDISNTPTGWVPLIVRELAASDADFFETNNSVSSTTASAGFYTVPPIPPQGFGLPATQPACYALNSGQKYAKCPVTSNQCDASLPCTPPGNLCNPQSGCCQAETVNCTVPFSLNCTATSPVCVGCDFTTNCCPPNPPPK
jgi:hypothetical protein